MTLRRRPVVVVIAACLAAVGFGTAAAPAAAPSRLLVGGDEWRLTLSRKSVQPGRTLIEFQNRGEDDHDLRLRRITSKPNPPTARWAETSPGGLTDLTVRVSRGRYRLWCSLLGHEELGMRATLRVSRKR